MDEASEMDRVPAFNRQSFEALFRLHYSSLCSAAYYIVSDEDAAKDIVQGFFLYCWSKRMSISLKGDFRHYAIRAVRNASLNYLKQAHKFTFFEDTADDYASTDPIGERTSREEEEIRNRELWAAIDRLPAQRKQIFLLSNRDGYTYAQVAGHLGISVNTVKTQIRLAYQFLREECRWLLPMLLLFFISKIIILGFTLSGGSVAYILTSYGYISR